MPWTLEVVDGGTRLALAGTVDVFEAVSLHRTLVALAAAPARVDVDFAGCQDLDSSALQLLVAFRRAREAGGHAVAFRGAAGRVQRVLGRFALQSPDGEIRRPGPRPVDL